jgi:DNA-binding transcriptional LysR family regulator
VSEMVRNLEERLGVRLVERTTRSVACPYRKLYSLA